MTAVNCPLCELRFATRTERDWQLRNEHRHRHPHPPAQPEPGGTQERVPAGPPEPSPADGARVRPAYAGGRRLARARQPQAGHAAVDREQRAGGAARRRRSRSRPRSRRCRRRLR
jgi:hypothetical protein